MKAEQQFLATWISGHFGLTFSPAQNPSIVVLESVSPEFFSAKTCTKYLEVSDE